MTFGLPCDRDGYDLRNDPCTQCGSRGCPEKDNCKTEERLAQMQTIMQRTDRIKRAVFQSEIQERLIKALERCADELEESIENEGPLASFKQAAQMARSVLAEAKGQARDSSGKMGGGV